MSHKIILLCAVIGVSTQNTWGMDELQKRAQELQKKIQKEIVDLYEEEATQRTSGLLKLEGLVRQNSNICNEPEFATIRPKLRAFHKTLKESNSADISCEMASTATALAKEFEAAVKQYQENKNATNNN
jgi:hypothetical protein